MPSKPRNSTPAFDLLDTPLSPGVTVLEASAGTGKTYALAALVLRLVAEEGIPIGRIVVTTFTITATAELRDRIRARLSEAHDALHERFQQNPTPFILEFAARHAGSSQVKQRIAGALRDFDQACISTIHSLCQRILQERTFESGTRPSMEIIPDESALVLETAMDFWRRKFSAREPGLTPFAIHAGISPESLAKLYREAANHPGALIRPDANAAATLGGKLLEMIRDFKALWPRWRETTATAFGDESKWAKTPYNNSDKIAPQLALLDELANSTNPPLLAYRATDFFRRTVIEPKFVRAKHQMPANAFAVWCDELADLREQYGAALRSEFIAWAGSDLAARKSALGLVAFGDLLSLVDSALQRDGGDALASVLQERYSAALVDEFQDTDPMQAEIFERVFAKSPQRLFLIGDPKQAIYGFRGADLHTYLRVARKADRTFRLDTNHRSDAPLVRAVNELFSKPQQPFIDASIRFEPVKAARAEEARPLRFGNTSRPAMRFWFWDSGEENITVTEAQKTLPAVVASEIARMLGGATLGERPLMPRDCAVLCRMNRECQSVQAELAARNIPAVVLSASSVFASDEACELSIILHAIARPERESALRAALATRLMGLTAAELENLAAAATDWESVISRFHTYHRFWGEHGFLPMFNNFVHAETVRQRLLALPQGDRRLTNLLHLAELIHSAASEFQYGIDSILRWLAAQIGDEAGGEANELRLERDDDAVKILTIHKSKGLEWPVVFCPFLWEKADAREGSLVSFHNDLGRTVIDLGTEQHDHASGIRDHELLAEHLRLLYVALTRARHECHVVWGRFNKCENSGLVWLLESAGEGTDDAPSTLKARVASFTSPMLRRTVENLAASQPAHFSVEPLPTSSDDVYSPKTEAPQAGPARIFRGTIDRTWRVSSFTALTAQRDTEDADRDPIAAPLITVPREGIHAFPTGIKAGNCLHDILERVDFTQPSKVRAIVGERLRAHAMYSIENIDAVTSTVADLVRVPLDSELTLGDVAFEKTLRELEFHLPSGLITPAQLSQFTASGLVFESRRGVLKGFMDLVFEHNGRFHILDWKSNRLGSSTSDYTPAAMEAEIAHHRYELQWQLYTLALHRYLHSRLGADYDPRRHIGTVFYVFLRGVDPTQPDLGIHRATPDFEALERMDSLFKGK